MAQVELLKKTGKYTDKDGEEKSFVNFYVRCGDSLIPIQPCYFPDPKHDDKDYQYNGRKEVLKAFASILPDKDKSADKTPADNKRGNKPQLEPITGGDGPF